MKNLNKIIVLSIIVLFVFASTALVQDKTPFVYDWENRKSDIPDKHVFQTDYLGGTQIVFDHEFHAGMLELDCIECHHVEGCAHCHKAEVTEADIQEAKVALHKNCFACHADMACIDCHRQ